MQDRRRQRLSASDDGSWKAAAASCSGLTKVVFAAVVLRAPREGGDGASSMPVVRSLESSGLLPATSELTVVTDRTAGGPHVHPRTYTQKAPLPCTHTARAVSAGEGGLYYVWMVDAAQAGYPMKRGGAGGALASAHTSERTRERTRVRTRVRL
jgi:hypothetical protein